MKSIFEECSIVHFASFHLYNHPLTSTYRKRCYSPSKLNTTSSHHWNCHCGYLCAAAPGHNCSSNSRMSYQMVCFNTQTPGCMLERDNDYSILSCSSVHTLTCNDIIVPSSQYLSGREANTQWWVDVTWLFSSCHVAGDPCYIMWNLHVNCVCKSHLYYSILAFIYFSRILYLLRAIELLYLLTKWCWQSTYACGTWHM